MVNMDMMQQMIWSQFARATEQWPPEMKTAMKNIEVDVVKQQNRIVINTRLSVEDENTEKTRDVLLSTLMHPISRVIGAFQCKVTTYK